MAWEWVSPIATACAGAFGVYFTWFAGKQGREHAERISNFQLMHARALATESREQQRLESAYIQLLKEAERVGNWVNVIYPLVDTVPPRPEPVLPTLDEQATTAALVHAFGSKAVKERMQAWRDVALYMTHLAGVIRTEESGGDKDFLHRKMFADRRPEESAARMSLAEQIATELKASAHPHKYTDPKRFPMLTMQDD